MPRMAPCLGRLRDLRRARHHRGADYQLLHPGLCARHGRSGPAHGDRTPVAAHRVDEDARFSTRVPAARVTWPRKVRARAVAIAKATARGDEETVERLSRVVA